MGALYLATEIIAGQARKVVIKEMLDYYEASDPQGRIKAQRRFEQEAITLANLNIPGIPQIFGYFSENNRNFIIMQFIEGQNLESGLTHLDENLNRKAGRAYPLEQVRRWGIRLCRVLESLALHKVAHLDIKPANLILDRLGEIWLVDFGTAKAPRAPQPMGGIANPSGQRRSSVYGTMGYAPPEQSTGNAEERSDVYALAATMYHLATDDDPGVHPGQFPKLNQLPADFSGALDKALATDVKKRITAREFSVLLEPRTTRPLGFYWQDGTVSLDMVSLAQTANRKWDEALHYYSSGDWEKWLKDQHRHDLAAQLNVIKAYYNDLGLGLDAFLRVLDPTLPPAQLYLHEIYLDAGQVPWRRKQTVDFIVQNHGAGCLLARFTQLPAGLSVNPLAVEVHESVKVTLSIDGGLLTPANQRQTLAFVLDAGNAGQQRIEVRLVVPEPHLVTATPNLDLGSVFRGAPVATSLAVENQGASDCKVEVECKTDGWYFEPEKFTCPTGVARQLQVMAEPRRMRFGANKVDISLIARAGAWEMILPVQVSLDVSLFRTVLHFGGPPLTWALVPGILLALLFGLIFHSLGEAQLSPLYGGMSGAFMAILVTIPLGIIAGASGKLSFPEGREGGQAGAIIGLVIGIVVGGIAGVLAGWLGLSLALLGAFTGALTGMTLGLIAWTIFRR